LQGEQRRVPILPFIISVIFHGIRSPEPLPDVNREELVPLPQNVNAQGLTRMALIMRNSTPFFRAFGPLLFGKPRTTFAASA